LVVVEAQIKPGNIHLTLAAFPALNIAFVQALFFELFNLSLLQGIALLQNLIHLRLLGIQHRYPANDRESFKDVIALILSHNVQKRQSRPVLVILIG